jgi:DNA-binding GntR family transcriptional regulator
MASSSFQTSIDRDQFSSAADYAYAALRDQIVSGRFAPGRRLTEVELAGLLGISRTPTRLALSRLEAEGLAVLRPRIGLVVASLESEAVFELYELRAALEGTAAAMAARHAGPRDIELLQRLLEEETRLPETPQVRYRHNRVLHDALYEAAHNRFLVKSLQALHDSMALLGRTTFSAKGRAAVAHAEHRRIVEAIARRDPEAAERHAREHVNQALAVRQSLMSGK